MHSMPVRHATSFLCSGLMVVTPLIAPGCGLPIPTIPALGLSSTKLDVGAFLTIRHDAITPGSTVAVLFRGPAGTVTRVKTSYTQEGLARVPVPPLFDAVSGELASGAATVSIEGIASDQSITINAPPVLENRAPGEFTMLFLQTCINNYSTGLGELAGLDPAVLAQVNAAGMAADMQAGLNQLQAIINEIAATGQWTTQVDGRVVTLTGRDLAAADRVLAAVVAGLVAEFEAVSPSVAKSKAAAASAPASPSDAHLQEMARRQADGLENASYGAEMFTAAMGVVVAASFAAFGGELAVVGTGVGLAVAGVSALSSMISYSTKRLGSALRQGSARAYDGAQRVTGYVRGVAVDVASAVTRGVTSTALGVFSLGSTVYDFFSAARSVKCANATPATQPTQLAKLPDINLCSVEYDEVVASCGSTSPFSFYILDYKTADGTTYYRKTRGDGTSTIDLSHLDLFICGDPARPTFSWRGPDIAFVGVSIGYYDELWAVVSASALGGGALSSPIKYGTYPSGTLNYWPLKPSPGDLTPVDADGRRITYHANATLAGPLLDDHKGILVRFQIR